MTNSLEPSGFSAEPSSARAVWRWRLSNAAGDEVASTQAGQSFPSQSDAESWVGEVWRELAEEGVDEVTLFEGDRLVYGPMSLHHE